MSGRTAQSDADWPQWAYCALPPLGVPLTVLAALMHPLLGGAILVGTLFALVGMLAYLAFGSPDFSGRTRVLLLLWNAAPFVALFFAPIDWSSGG